MLFFQSDFGFSKALVVFGIVLVKIPIQYEIPGS